MSNTHDETMKMPGGGDPVSAARARIAALTDTHLEGDHPLLRTPLPVEPEVTAAEKKPKTEHHKKVPGHKLTSPMPPAGMPAEWVGNNRRIRPLPSKARPIASAVASFVLLMLVFKSQIIISQIQYWTSAKTPAATQTVQTQPEVGPAPLISIPKIKVKAPVVYVQSVDEASIQKGLQSGVVHYATTAVPGEPGNTVIVGHSSNDWWEPGHYKFVFVLLDKLTVGDKFSVNYNSKRYVYRVTKTKIVEPSDLSVLRQTSTPTITLITCTPPGTSWHRLVVSAKQISPVPQTAKAKQTILQPSLLSKLPGNAPDFLAQIKQLWQSLIGFFTGHHGSSGSAGI